MTTISIPATVDRVRIRLNDLHSLLTAKGWERAACVAAFVRLEPTDGRPLKAKTTLKAEGLFSPEQFAELGIQGLRSPQTVRFYVKAWLAVHDGEYPSPGQLQVELPNVAFPVPASTVMASFPATPATVAPAPVAERGRPLMEVLRETFDDEQVASMPDPPAPIAPQPEPTHPPSPYPVQQPLPAQEASKAERIFDRLEAVVDEFEVAWNADAWQFRDYAGRLHRMIDVLGAHADLMVGLTAEDMDRLRG